MIILCRSSRHFHEMHIKDPSAGALEAAVRMRDI